MKKIALACAGHGRDPQSVHLVAVSKMQPPDLYKSSPMRKDILFFTAHHIVTRYGRGEGLRFFLNAQLHAKDFFRWQTFVDSNLSGDVFSEIRPRLSQKVFRPYLRPRFDVGDRVSFLRAHYSLLCERFPSAVLPLLLSEPGVELGDLTGKSGRRYAIFLGTSTTKEGEVGVSFIDQSSGAYLACLRAVIGAAGKEERVLWIGGLQGAKPPMGRDDIVQATRELNGLRPKHAVLQAACVLSEWLGIHKMIAPGRSDHISQRAWRKFLPKRKIHADYDSFWEEFGAVITATDDYELRLPLPRRTLEEVASKRRKEWSRRYDRLDALSGAIKYRLESLAQEKTKGDVTKL